METLRFVPARTKHTSVALGRSITGRKWRYVIVLALLVLAAVLGRRASVRVVALLVAAVALPLILHELRLGLLALPAIALFVPLEIGTGTKVSLNLAVFAIPAFAALWLVRGLLHRRIHLTPSRLNRPLVAFLLVTLLSLLRGNAMWDSMVPRPSNMILVQLSQVSIYILSFVVFWLMANLATDLAWLRRIAYAFVVTGGIAGFVLLFLRGLPLQQALFPRGGLSNLVWVWLVALSLALALYDPQLKHWQRALLFLVLVNTMIWVWLFQRTWYAAWIPPLMAIGAILWWHSPRSRWPLALGAIPVVVVVGLPRLLREMGWEYKWLMSGGSRLALWQSVIELASQCPLLGLGPAAYRHYHFLKPLTYGQITWLIPSVSAHNMFVDLFAQVGLLGAACYVWFLVEAALMARRLHAKFDGFAQGYALAVLGALVGTVTADMVAATSLPFVYNIGFWGFRGSALSWMLLGGLAVLESSGPKPQTADISKDAWLC